MKRDGNALHIMAYPLMNVKLAGRIIGDTIIIYRIGDAVITTCTSKFLDNTFFIRDTMSFILAPHAHTLFPLKATRQCSTILSILPLGYIKPLTSRYPSTLISTANVAEWLDDTLSN